MPRHAVFVYHAKSMKHVPTLVGSVVLALSVAACAVATPGADTGTGENGTYVSPLGFSIDLPAAVYIGGENETAPVRAFEDLSRNRVFISAAEHDDPATPAFDRVPTTLPSLTGIDRTAVLLPSWMLSMTDIEDREALDAWVKNHYGPGCRVAELAPEGQEGVFDVLLEGDGKPLDQTECPLNYVYEILYQPSERRVLSWELGQGIQFMSDRDGATIFDLRMRDSVRFR